ncbi:hypothetical protein DAEQUDRAFT_211554 [Daedalea quercina L-15889]|uniref:Uncharacterized protein n=1 Tax=Daedalea quercina L-15889 TaxID=1314783 RepID=A0A165RAX5_9APHY|nr:hypothetical protein DAEQUDRAFT_211554 [Daedalea quercina L-15889]
MLMLSSHPLSTCAVHWQAGSARVMILQLCPILCIRSLIGHTLLRPFALVQKPRATYFECITVTYSNPPPVKHVVMALLPAPCSTQAPQLLIQDWPRSASFPLIYLPTLTAPGSQKCPWRQLSSQSLIS